MLTLMIKPDGEEPYQITADSRDVLLWERIGPRNNLRRLIESPVMSDHYSLAHIAIKRQRLRDIPPLDEFIEHNAIRVINETSEVLDYEELITVIDKALVETSMGSPVTTVADAVVDLIERLRMRSIEPNPTRPGRLPGPL